MSDQKNLQTTIEVNAAQQTASAIEAQKFYESLKESAEAETLLDAIAAAATAIATNQTDSEKK